MTWRQVSKETGVSASTLTRMAQGRRPDVDGLAALLAWSSLKTEQFIRSEDARGADERPSTVAMISTYLRSDPHLTREGAEALENVIRVAYHSFALKD